MSKKDFILKVRIAKSEAINLSHLPTFLEILEESDIPFSTEVTVIFGTKSSYKFLIRLANGIKAGYYNTALPTSTIIEYHGSYSNNSCYR